MHIEPQALIFRAAHPVPEGFRVLRGVERFHHNAATFCAGSLRTSGVGGVWCMIIHNLRNTKLHRRQFLGCGMSVLVAPVFNRLRAADYSTRAMDLVAQSNVIDMLGLLTLDWPLLDRWQSAPGNFGEADFRKLQNSGINVFHPAVAFEDARAYAITRAWFDKWNRLIDQHPAWFLRIDECHDLARAKAEGKIGIILGMQDANHLRDLADLDAFYKMGQRLTQLTYNSENRLGAGCTATKDRGLTEFGQAVVARMNAMGMAIDVSHCGERTTLDAIAASKKPVLITHSNCKSLAPGVARCKTDEAIVAAARNGGVIGLTGVRHFVRAKDPVTLDDALNHFDHVVKIAGVEHVGVGSDTDLDGRGPQADIAGLNRVNRIFELTEGLIRRGYTDEQIGLILGGNFQRALQQIWERG
jgi:membrane dipeptidase